ncbi:MAG: UDP-N-acetylmuramate:L-alanyl-gamma-D-glutamyl-meso-diaminopimelate ligase [Methylacidiphilales bacterium]|nr:UDP-N-acetylmuramate:L-alanyl-gamma-D-glutamyl-meso-diaminopimelate ligase [Candidatus Methylacidiphilales bacterium]MDW8348753.1 UDP-N-acetylmuramate:L-alanyl-gamma-D-glutamyl-meso-diaminopimelate ligase [Verrucomicrobiae bacterium]
MNNSQVPLGLHDFSIPFHFIGICGTAMGAVAAMLKRQGYKVTGSDEQIYPPMSTFLENEGISVQKGYRPENLPGDPSSIIIVGNTIKRGNPEIEAVLNQKRFYISLPEALKTYFLRGKRNVVITGTHGKTTTTSITAWLLESAQLHPSFLIGGIPENFGLGCRHVQSDFWILEGDEYDTAFFDKRSKFIHYLPEIVVINNIEFDHADIYENLDAIKLSFRRLMNIIPQNGLVIYNADDTHACEVASTALAKKIGVSMRKNSGVQNISDIQLHPQYSAFTYLNQRFTLPMAGEINIRNAAMAITVAQHLGIPLHQIAIALREFKGVRRRQQHRGEVNGIHVIDDFGHHPTAIRETIRAIRQQYPRSRIWAIFEPRSNTTRRAVFQNILPDALATADAVIVAQVAALQQIPENERLNPERVVKDIQAKGVPAYYEPHVDAIIQRVLSTAQVNDVLLILSNGGFDQIHDKLLHALAEKKS